MINYLYDAYTILNKVYSEKAYLKQAIKDTFIEEKNRSLTIKTVYGVLDKDIELSYYLKRLTEKSPKLVIRTVLKISMYAIKYLEKKEYAVIDNAVTLVKKLGKGGTAGFVNAFLRRFVKEKIPFPKNEIEYLSVKYSCPEFMVKEYLTNYGKERTERILSAQNGLNTLCFYEVDGKKYLTERKVNYKETPFNNVFSVKNFVMDEGFERGEYTFQSIGSVAVTEVVEKGEKLLDCCSAPGGKSVRLSYKFDSVISCDIHEHRIELVKSYAKRMKRENITALALDSMVFNPDFKEKFDAVLVDAPCSGTGVVNDNPDIKLNRVEQDLISLTNEQIEILENVKNYVKKGGYLYYSTCSIMTRENYSTVEKFLKKNPEFIIEKIDSKLPHEDINGTNLFLPDISCGVGFYVAKLKRES